MRTPLRPIYGHDTIVGIGVDDPETGAWYKVKEAIDRVIEIEADHERLAKRVEELEFTMGLLVTCGLCGNNIAIGKLLSHCVEDHNWRIEIGDSKP